MRKRDIRVGMTLFVPPKANTQYGGASNREIVVGRMDDVSVQATEAGDHRWYLFDAVTQFPTKCAGCTAIREFAKFRSELGKIRRNLNRELDALEIW